MSADTTKGGHMRVADVLKKKGALVSTVPPNARISDAVATLYERGIGAVVVSSDRKRIDGLSLIHI